MNNHGIIVLMSCIIILMGLAVRFWYEYFRKPKTTRVTICWKCKYCIRRRWIKRTFCRTPSDKWQINYVTGKTYKPTFNCARHNSHGTCEFFKKVWWR